MQSRCSNHRVWSSLAMTAGVMAACGAVHAQPVNDDCSGAIDITAFPALVSGSTSTAASETLGFCGTGDGSGGGVWYRMMGTGGTFSASTCDDETFPGSATYDTKIRVFSDCSGTCVAGNDDSCSGFRSTVQWDSTNGQAYFILVHGFGGASGDFSLSVWEDVPGACCFFDSSCQELSASACVSQGGEFGGAGTSCQGAGCPDLTGACCFPNGTCDDTLAGPACTTGGGVFNGIGTDCAGANCQATAGACCFLNGSCNDLLDANQCAAQGGSFNGVGTSCGGVNCPDLLNGPDVVYTECNDVQNWGSVGTIHGYSLASHTCNIGDENLFWGNSQNGTPILAMNAYRFSGGRLEQIGMSWCKHACCAAAGPGCPSVSCNGAGGSVLGAGCRDIYGAGWNGGQSRLGPRSDVNAFNGNLIQAPGGSGNAIFKRLQIDESDMMDAGLYFVEGVYMGSDDAAAGNAFNNASYKRVTVNTSNFELTPTGPMELFVPAIYAWRDHGNGVNSIDNRVQIKNYDVPGEGRFVAAGRASDNGDGTWRYEYLFFNLNSHRSGGSVNVPVPADVTVTNVGFHDVDYHSGEPYDNTDWGNTVDAAGVTWSSPQSHADNPNSNALRWGTMYNFWFDANTGPTDGNVTLGTFIPGAVNSVTETLPVPSSNDCFCELDGSAGLTVFDLLAYLSLWFDFDTAAELTGDVPADINVFDLLAYLDCWFSACE